MSNSCGNCRFSKEINGDLKCVRNPPGIYDQDHPEHPGVKENDGPCGEWMIKAPPEV